MRRRITFVQKPTAPFDPDQTTLTPDSLTIQSLDALREERITVSHEELPAELRQLLRESGQVHVRWATDREAESVAPFSSRIASGLHAFSRDGTELCPILKVFGADCSKTSFTSPERPAEAYYYTLLRSPTNLATYLQNNLCQTNECKDAADKLHSADSIDFNYDGTSQVTLSAVWASPPAKNGWSETIPKPADGDQIEIGLLGSENNAADIEDLKMGGLLGVIGRDKALKPTIFTFPSRHHPLDLDAKYTVSFEHPTGLHPTMTISLSQEALTPPPADKHATCALHTHLTLPSTVFADKYQLSTTDPLFLASHRLVALRAVSGETDLEAPDWSVDQWGSNWLLELDTSLDQNQNQGQSQSQDKEQNKEKEKDDSMTSGLNVTIPLHLRYLDPSASGYRAVEVPWPVVFWACELDGKSDKMAGNPFDRVRLGWDGLFRANTMFYQVHPMAGGSGFVETIDVPVLDTGIVSSRMVELGTIAVITLGFAWVLWKLGLSFRQTKKKDE